MPSSPVARPGQLLLAILPPQADKNKLAKINSAKASLGLESCFLFKGTPLWNWIVATWMKWMAAADPFNRHPTAF